MAYFYSVTPTFLGILLLVSQTKTDSLSVSDCTELLKNFADVVSNFTFCAVSNSRPFRFCIRCKHEYTAVINKHRDIVTGDCHKDLVMAEKNQLVESAFQFVEDLWKSCNCPDCFKTDKHGIPIAVKQEIKTFFHKLQEVELCINNNSKICPFPLVVNISQANTTAKTVCNDCERLYRSLAQSYKNITNSDSIEYKVCGDVSASMNYTRQCWSKTLKCTKIHTDLVSVLSLTIFFCFLPVIFYTSVKMQGDSKNRNTGSFLVESQN
ncbi:osteopetrosis-associated transmembrane protein 1-like isoform X1 [Acropora palmata]|uniref:osteopetrosis-associated transmembrane protein 1-like isoform X1 n=1 Tax=Acropora palmata TaxID=6131 RepID=UPI003DA150D3